MPFQIADQQRSARHGVKLAQKLDDLLVLEVMHEQNGHYKIKASGRHGKSKCICDDLGLRRQAQIYCA
jgi:hypothetical protein